MLGIPASGRHGKREIGRRTTNKRLPGLLPAVIFCDIRQGPRRGNQLRYAAKEAATQGRFGKSRLNAKQIQHKADSTQGRRDAKPIQRIPPGGKPITNRQQTGKTPQQTGAGKRLSPRQRQRAPARWRRSAAPAPTLRHTASGKKRLRFEPADGLREPVDGLQERLQFAGRGRAQVGGGQQHGSLPAAAFESRKRRIAPAPVVGSHL